MTLGRVFPGDVNWTEEGHRFAWRMMLRSKQPPWTDHRPHPGLRYVVRDPVTGAAWTADLEALGLRDWQLRKARSWPLLTHQVAGRIEAACRARGLAEVEVYADCVVSLNGHPPCRLIDPHVDLTAVRPRWLGRDPWVLGHGAWPWTPDDPTVVMPRR